MNPITRQTKRQRNVSAARKTRGATIIEYILLVTLLSVAATLFFDTVASSVNTRFESTASIIGS